MKRITALILCVFMLLPTLTGCEINFKPKEDIPANGEQNENEKPSGDNGKTPTDSPTSNGNDPALTVNSGDIDLDDFSFIDADGRDWSKYDWTNFDPANLPVDLGKASFTVDNSATATGEYIPGESLTLSVTDSAGAKWTLNIPGSALMYPETIKMTATKDIAAGELGSFDGGVIFEPDGLQFLEPATLTVSGGGWGEDCILLTGGHDGSNLKFVEYETDENSATATIRHFSSGLGQKEPHWNQYDQKLLDQFRRAVGYAQDILKKPLKTPVPSSLTCNVCANGHRGNDNKKQNEKFFEELFEPEKSAMDSLSIAWTGLMNGRRISSTTYTDTVLSDIHQHYRNALVMRLLRKAKQLIDTYKYQEDMFIWIALAMPGLMSCRGAVNFKVSSRHWEEPSDMAALRAEIQAEVEKWAKEVWNLFMRKLVEEHDYTAFHALSYIMLLFVFSDIDAENCPQYLYNAMTFRVEWELEEHAFFTICSKGEVTVSMNQIKDDDYFGEADGDGKLTKFDDPEGHVYVPSFPSFNNKAQLYKLDPCITKTITVDIDKFGTDFTAMARTEQGDYPVPFPDYPEPLLHMMDGHFSFSTALYTFKLDLNNLDEKCADSSFKAQQEELSHTLDIKIFHQPKDDVFMK